MVSTLGQRAEVASKTESDLPDGLLSRVIYGTKEGRELDAQLEASFSAVLARGKYVHSIVFHEVKPDKVDEYVKLVGNWYPKMASSEKNKVHLVGSWRTEVGDCDTFGMSPSSQTWSYLLTYDSPHLGVPAVPRLSRVSEQHLQTARLRRV